MAKKNLGVVRGARAATAMALADRYTAGDLAKRMAKLKARSAATGSASEMLQQYANHFTMLAYRTSDGGAELHQQFADIFFVARGKAVLVTGGSIPNAVEEGPGELRGKAVKGGKRTALGAGDVVHIPAGLPHQILVPNGRGFLYFVIKVKEHD